jgi:mRNA interferase MazF
MKRGEFYRVRRPSARETRRSRVFIVLSRQALIDSRFSTVICAPVYSAYHGLATQVPVGQAEGLKHDCAIHCDELMSLPEAVLTDFVGTLAPPRWRTLDAALRIALGTR